MKICEWCKKPILDSTDGRQKYHKGRCSEEARKESWRRASRKYYRNHKDIIKMRRRLMGSGWLSAHKKRNIEDEFYEIIKEMKRLKLR